MGAGLRHSLAAGADARHAQGAAPTPSHAAASPLSDLDAFTLVDAVGSGNKKMPNNHPKATFPSSAVGLGPLGWPCADVPAPSSGCPPSIPAATGAIFSTGVAPGASALSLPDDLFADGPRASTAPAPQDGAADAQQQSTDFFAFTSATHTPAWPPAPQAAAAAASPLWGAADPLADLF
eukprot:GHVT01032660.1.p1 GENE.GHVT01032660.1~~GHVT01032660.1.p1  ORF type:complete len:198 (-),score=76.62 GHVT01032660.1:17-553(-)